MNDLARAGTYVAANPGEFLRACARHVELVALVLTVALAIGLPGALLTSRSRLFQWAFLKVVLALRVLPSLAVLFLAIPSFGLTTTSAAIALVVLAVPPILLNTDAALRAVPRQSREVAVGLGMTSPQRLIRVELPLALPGLLAGLKTAAVETIASATLAAFIGAGGLGTFIVRGFALNDVAPMLVGAIPVSLLAVGAEVALDRLRRVLCPHV